MRYASLSLDLHNPWSNLKTHGDPGWRSNPPDLDAFMAAGQSVFPA